MPLPLEDYALIGDCHTAALVGRDGSIDWLCMPRFDSGACFAALLGTSDNGHWRLAPTGGVRRVRRGYRDETLVLETEYETEDGVVAVLDFMPPRDRDVDVVRLVEGRAGRVPMRTELVMRFDYGAVVPWVTRPDLRTLRAIAGPDLLLLRTPVPLRGEHLTTRGEFVVEPGDRVPFVLTWQASHLPVREAIDPEHALARAERVWHSWAERCTYDGPYSAAVNRSLLVLKALTYAPTGGIAAAPTTSLPEQLGGVRNWDYRYCWVRDATFTLLALLSTGYTEEATAWREWLLRAVAGSPDQLQIMYGLAGERRLTEFTVDALPGYQGARPVRVGNAASQQFQLDVYGELIDCLYQVRRAGLAPLEASWALEASLLDFLEGAWRRPDEGIWEVRGPRRHFTHSKVMAWVAFDRAVKTMAYMRQGCPAPVDRWRAARDEIHREVCREGYDPSRNTFVQSYGARELDASLLMMPLVGFLPAHDPRMQGTVAAIERELLDQGFVRRYSSGREVDGLPEGEGAFLPCSFWYVDNLALQGRRDEARAMFERLLAVRSDEGLLAEEYDPSARRMVGNFPQAFSHVALVNSALNLAHEAGPARHRQRT